MPVLTHRRTCKYVCCFVNLFSVETVVFKPVNKYNSPQIKMRQDI